VSVQLPMVVVATGLVLAATEGGGGGGGSVGIRNGSGGVGGDGICNGFSRGGGGRPRPRIQCFTPQLAVGRLHGPERTGSVAMAVQT
jgi:hypothetical protein